MEFKHSINILSDYIKEIESIIYGLETTKKIPAIEVDLLLDKTRNFYEMLLMLRKNTFEAGIKDEIEDKVTVQDKEVIEPENTETEKKHNETITEEASKVVTVKVDNVKTDPVKEIIVTTEIKEDPKILSDRFKGQKTFNDSIGQTKSFQDLTSKVQSKPVSNLANAIGLNEKFAFIHSLFRGDVNKYNQTMQILNNASNFNDAYNYLIENFDWDMNSEPVQKILELIRRKFIVNKNG